MVDVTALQRRLDRRASRLRTDCPTDEGHRQHVDRPERLEEGAAGQSGDRADRQTERGRGRRVGNPVRVVCHRDGAGGQTERHPHL